MKVRLNCIGKTYFNKSKTRCLSRFSTGATWIGVFSIDICLKFRTLLSSGMDIFERKSLTHRDWKKNIPNSRIIMRYRSSLCRWRTFPPPKNIVVISKSDEEILGFSILICDLIMCNTIVVSENQIGINQ